MCVFFQAFLLLIPLEHFLFRRTYQHQQHKKKYVEIENDVIDWIKIHQFFSDQCEVSILNV